MTFPLMMFTMPLTSSPKTSRNSKNGSSSILPKYANGIFPSPTLTVRTTILTSDVRTWIPWTKTDAQLTKTATPSRQNTGSAVLRRTTAPTLSWKWGFSWTGTTFRSRMISFRGTNPKRFTCQKDRHGRPEADGLLLREICQTAERGTRRDGGTREGSDQPPEKI